MVENRKKWTGQIITRLARGLGRALLLELRMQPRDIAVDARCGILRLPRTPPIPSKALQRRTVLPDDGKAVIRQRRHDRDIILLANRMVDFALCARGEFDLALDAMRCARATGKGLSGPPGLLCSFSHTSCSLLLAVLLLPWLRFCWCCLAGGSSAGKG